MANENKGGGIQPVIQAPQQRAGGLLAEAKTVVREESPAPKRKEEEVEVHSSAVEVDEEAPSSDPAMRLIRVRPRRTELRVRIGLEWYSFEAGKPQNVPKLIVSHLEEKGII